MQWCVLWWEMRMLYVSLFWCFLLLFQTVLTLSVQNFFLFWIGHTYLWRSVKLIVKFSYLYMSWIGICFRFATCIDRTPTRSPIVDRMAQLLIAVVEGTAYVEYVNVIYDIIRMIVFMANTASATTFHVNARMAWFVLEMACVNVASVSADQAGQILIVQVEFRVSHMLSKRALKTTIILSL